MALSSILLWSEQGLLGDLRYKTLDLSRLSQLAWHSILGYDGYVTDPYDGKRTA